MGPPLADFFEEMRRWAAPAEEASAAEAAEDRGASRQHVLERLGRLEAMTDAVAGRFAALQGEHEALLSEHEALKARHPKYAALDEQIEVLAVSGY